MMTRIPRESSVMDREARWYQGAFEPDGFGSLRDIVILDTDEQDWQARLEFLRRSSYLLECRVDDRTTALPRRISEIFAIRQSASPVLSIDLQGVPLRSHFFVPSRIELSFDPRDVDGSDHAAVLPRMMQELADAVGNPGLLTRENTPGDPIIRVNTASQHRR